MLTFICAVILTTSGATHAQNITVYFDAADVQSFVEDTHHTYSTKEQLHKAVCNNLQLAIEIESQQ